MLIFITSAEFLNYILQTQQKLTALGSLSLHNCILDDNAINEITQINTLFHLDLAGSAIQRALPISKLVNLEHLDLSISSGVESNAIISIANKCNKLNYLDISGCSSISQPALKELAKRENLEQLIIQHVENVNNDMFATMRKLKVLDCSYCEDVTDVGIMGVIKLCQNLQRLNIVETGVTIETLNYAADKVKCRKNNVVLVIVASDSLKREFDHSKNISPLLEIKQYHDINRCNPS